MSKNTSLGDRMKNYEALYGLKVVPRTIFAIRLDGKNFSKYTNKLDKPFDKEFSKAMDQVAVELCKEFNPNLAYTQSDEITLIFANTNPQSDMIFDGKIQKLVSLTAAFATATFNEIRNRQHLVKVANEAYDARDFIFTMTEGLFILPKQATFDARIIPLPSIDEAFNNLLWRQRDATKNSISMAAETVFSHNELMKKNGNEKQEMLFQKGINWNNYPVKFKRGIVIKKFPVQVEAPNTPAGVVVRNKWKPDYETPIFSEDREYLFNLLETKNAQSRPN